MREPFALHTAGGGAGRAAARGIGIVLLLVVALGLALTATACVRTGHVGVVTVFGRVTGQTLGEGLHVINPLASVTQLSVKTQEIKERASVPSKEGLIMDVEASILYHLDPMQAASVYQKIGPNYPEVLLIPTFRSGIRAVTAANSAAALYSDARESIARNIMDDVVRQLAPRGIIVEDVLLRD